VVVTATARDIATMDVAARLVGARWVVELELPGKLWAGVVEVPGTGYQELCVAREAGDGGSAASQSLERGYGAIGSNPTCIAVALPSGAMGVEANPTADHEVSSETVWLGSFDRLPRGYTTIVVRPVDDGGVDMARGRSVTVWV
jgi:hypothetical protein